MGRHSARPRSQVHGMRLVTNSSLVLLMTAVSCLIIYIGITTYANAKLAESQDPSNVVVSVPTSAATASPSTGANANASASNGDSLRTCPATGCQATTCHAETGEPPPGY